MQLLGCTQPLDGGDVVAVVHRRQGQARIDPPALDDHRAGTALAVIATLLGAGELQLLAQRVEQGGPRVEFQRAGLAVHGEGHLRDRRRLHDAVVHRGLRHGLRMGNARGCRRRGRRADQQSAPG